MKRLLILCLVLTLSGCASKARRQEQLRNAYLSGQQQALQAVVEARRINIRFIGPVLNSEVAWSDGLTLTQAIVAANYTAAGTPAEIVILRQQERIPVDVRALLRGADYALEPGDTIALHP
jgi:hypothetical protein